ncbi:RNA polymerase sigma-70 factor [Mucilaginibacter polytrichastri]|uniref:RNA polymerase sigma-70 factor n=1 Tax=Mucilaginibacter polytrichastri TaxID=1302689 RepID=UPI00209BAA1A|nr:RNA polymerase sigma-70 factor [Mucilaginibacter polytrichastri]
MSSLKTGNEAAIGEIYRRYWRKLLAIAFNHTKDKVAAEEIVQEVLIKLWDKRDQVKIDSLPNYLATATKFSVLTAIHRQKRRSDIALSVYGKTQHDFDDEKIYARFLQEYINGIVEKLPEKCRLVFKYSREEGRSIPQISVEMNIAEKTAEAHLTKALKVIRLSLRSIGMVYLVFLLNIIR